MVIDKVQKQSVEEGSNELLSCHTLKNDTVPILLLNCYNQPLHAYGNIGDTHHDEYGCFQTSFFRIEKVDADDCCVTLSLLRALNSYGCPAESVSDTFILEKTNFCITVDLNCFSALQYADPKLLKRKMPIDHKC
jgi:hypothetical protein